MSTEEKDKLLTYAMKMLERGDRFSDILLYLDRKGADNELKKEIIFRLEEHRKLMDKVKEKKKLYPVSIAKIVLGVLFFGLTLYLQYIGLIVFPWTIPGFLVAIGALIEFVKIILNTINSSKS
jgi:hypothetical protein